MLKSSQMLVSDIPTSNPKVNRSARYSKQSRNLSPAETGGVLQVLELLCKLIGSTSVIQFVKTSNTRGGPARADIRVTTIDAGTTTQDQHRR